MNIPAGVKVRSSSIVSRGQVLVMADFEHPETPIMDFWMEGGEIQSASAPVPDGRIIVCHPDDEQRVRDAVAVAQERPKWWEDWQAVERLIGRAVGGGTT